MRHRIEWQQASPLLIRIGARTITPLWRFPQRNAILGRESTEAEVEVIDELCMAFQRILLKKIGMFDESYRFPYYMAIDFNFAVRDSGFRAVVTPNLPIKSYPPFQDANLSDAERTRLKKRNFYRFLDKWGHRDDLLLNNEE